MNKYIEYFTNYVFMNYDMNDANIRLKYYHSLRVAKIMAFLARKLNMSEEDIELAFKLGLCHDLGRFYEVVLNGKFDNLRFDHGSYSNKILYNDTFIRYMDVDEHLLFRKAIYNHNKKDVTEDLTEREKLFANLLRDADKIDILAVQINGKKRVFSREPSKKVLEEFENGLSVDLKNRDKQNKSDSIVFYLSFVKTLYYDVSYDTMIECGYLDGFLDSIAVDENKKELFNSIVSKLYERRGKEYVR